MCGPLPHQGLTHHCTRPALQRNICLDGRSCHHNPCLVTAACHPELPGPASLWPVMDQVLAGTMHRLSMVIICPRVFRQPDTRLQVAAPRLPIPIPTPRGTSSTVARSLCSCPHQTACTRRALRLNLCPSTRRGTICRRARKRLLSRSTAELQPHLCQWYPTATFPRVTTCLPETACLPPRQNSPPPTVVLSVLLQTSLFTSNPPRDRGSLLLQPRSLLLQSRSPPLQPRSRSFQPRSLLLQPTSLLLQPSSLQRPPILRRSFTTKPTPFPRHWPTSPCTSPTMS